MDSPSDSDDVIFDEDDDGFRRDRPPFRDMPVANDYSGVPQCPFCGDTIFIPSSALEGVALCVHDGIDIWIPPHLRG